MIFAGLKAGLSKIVKHSVLENSKVLSLVNHLNMLSINVSVVPQLKNRCNGVSLKAS
jgi:hypothetical protein